MRDGSPVGANGDPSVSILAVNFHYVRPPDDRYPKLHTRTPGQLRDQLDELSKIGECLAPANLQSILEERVAPPEDPAFVLTFDDGLKDHVTHVAPELERRGWKAFFFVNSAPWEGELLDVHKLQLLNATVPFPELYGAFTSFVRQERLGADPEQVPAARVREQYRYDEEQVARFKFAINMQLAPDARQAAVRRLFETFMGRDEDHVADLYLTLSECQTLNDMGHTIGCHSHRHRSLSVMSSKEREEDLSINRAAIERVTGTPPDWISFPWGSKDTVDEVVLAECRRQNIRFGFTMNRGLIQRPADLIALNRVDTNDAPGGKSPVINWP